MRYAWALLLPIILLSACGEQAEQTPQDVVARVNDEVLTASEITALLPPGEWDKMPMADKQAWVDDWTRLVLLSQMAAGQGIDRELATQSQIGNARRKILANALLARQLAVGMPQADAFEEEMHEYYQTQYPRTVYQFTGQRLTMFSAALADQVEADLGRGMSFYDVYQKYMPQNNIAYQRGTFTRDILPGATYDTLAAAERYKAVRAESDGCIDIIRYLDRQEQQLAFDNPKVQAEIRQMLEEQRQQELVERLLQQQEATSEIVIEL